MCEYIVERAAANLPQSTQSPLFTISGGRVVLTSLTGEVTTAVQNQTNNTKVVYNPTTGSDKDLSGAVELGNAAVGVYLGLDPDMMLASTPALQAATSYVWAELIRPIALGPGTVDLNCVASNTGQTKWTLVYRPLDSGAKVVAA